MFVAADIYLFQSPKSGKFESNMRTTIVTASAPMKWFQSPKSGKFESNNILI